jgi:hypothetical protein
MIIIKPSGHIKLRQRQHKHTQRERIRLISVVLDLRKPQGIQGLLEWRREEVGIVPHHIKLVIIPLQILIVDVVELGKDKVIVLADIERIGVYVSMGDAHLL